MQKYLRTISGVVNVSRGQDSAGQGREGQGSYLNAGIVVKQLILFHNLYFTNL